jgi:hypothetical protein
VNDPGHDPALRGSRERNSGPSLWVAARLGCAPSAPSPSGLRTRSGGRVRRHVPAARPLRSARVARHAVGRAAKFSNEVSSAIVTAPS